MSLEITGKLLDKGTTQVVSDRFKKREFVLELVEDTPAGTFTNYAKMQLVQNKVDLIERFNNGDMLRVSFSIKGNRYDKNGTVSYFTNLDAWRIEPAGEGGYETAATADSGFNSGFNSAGGNGRTAPQDFSATAAESADDLPF